MNLPCPRGSFKHSPSSAHPPGSAPCRLVQPISVHYTAQAPRASLRFENMAPGQRLVLCEETVRERSGLGPHRDLGTWGTDRHQEFRVSLGWPTWPVSSASMRMPLGHKRPWPVGREAEPTGRGCGGKGVAVVPESRWAGHVLISRLWSGCSSFFCSSFLPSSWVPTWHFVYEGCRSMFI